MTFTLLWAGLVLLAFSAIIFSHRVFQIETLEKKWVLGLYYVKIAAGVGYGLLMKKYKDSDTWRYFKESIAEVNILKSDPWMFVASLFQHGYLERGRFFASENSYWNDLKDNVFIKFLALCNVVSQNDYNTDVILCNVMFLLGVVLFTRLVCRFTMVNPLYVFLPAGLFPSFLFWCSGVHKDGLCFVLVVLLMDTTAKLLEGKVRIRWVLGFLAAFLPLFSQKSFVALIVLGGLLLWWLLDYIALTGKKFIGWGGLAFFVFISVAGGKKVMGVVAEKQHAFQMLEGNSKIPLPPLEGNAVGFLSYFPKAVDVAFFRPHWEECGNLLYAVSFAESLLILLLVAASVYFFSAGVKVPPFFMACFFITGCYFFVIGYTVTFTGAVVRYKATVIPLLTGCATALLHQFLKTRKS